jgi:hypothetical protein
MKYTDDQFEKADALADRLVPAYARRDPDSPIPMFSHRQPGEWFWMGFVMKLQKAGYDEFQIQTLLQSKLIRWMFDGFGSEKMMAAGYNLATEFLKDPNGIAGLLNEPDVVKS